MTRKRFLYSPLILLGLSLGAQAQLWSGILDSSRAIDWTQAGIPGGVPQRSTVCATVQASAYGNGSSDATAGIQSALKSCPANQAVVLSAGTFRINSSLSVPSNVTLRGAGANQTILDAHGSSMGVVNLGTGDPYPGNAVNISGGGSAGSTSLTLSSASNVTVGGYLLITELNDSSYVSINGDGGKCTWCDQFWNGTRTRGQIVEVTSVSGNSIGITPGLYSAYSNSPQAVPFAASAKYAGVEDLQVYANKTGYTSNFQVRTCAYCWVKGVEGNYTDGDHVQVHWGYRDEVRDSYFSNAYLHTPGTTDTDIFIVDKTTASLVENNILERLHVSIMTNWGSAGNVIAYNYSEGNFDSSPNTVNLGDFSAHGAHPQFTLWEGNVGQGLYPDSVWGTSSHVTAYRNWMRGTTKACQPITGRGTVNCTGSNAVWTFQAARAMQISSLATTYNFVGNVLGSAEQAALKNSSNNPIPQVATVQWSADRQYEYAYGWTFGFSNLSDSGTNSLDNTKPYTTAFFHGNYNNVDGSLTWANGVPHTLPASFYRTGKPSWWGSLAYPAVGPDVTGGSGPGGYAYGNPAQVCYQQTMGGTEGGAGSPLSFNADTCYGGSTPPPAPPTGLTVVVH